MKGLMVSGLDIAHEGDFFLNNLSRNSGFSNQNDVSGIGDEDGRHFLRNLPPEVFICQTHNLL